MGGEQFIFPKPRTLIQTLLQQTTSDDDLILDSFGGTGATAHAVLAQNAADGGNRRFILIEMDENICKTVTSERLKRVMSGYSYVNNTGKTIDIEGIHGGFRFCELAEPLFDADGSINKTVTFKELAHHIFFIATGEPLPSATDFSTPFLGTSNNIAVYLLYNGILGDNEDEGGNVLTRSVLSRLPKHESTKIVYGNGCLLGSSHLNRENIIFRQIPYEVRCS